MPLPYPKKDTPTDAPILDIITKRWSSIAFDPTPLSTEHIASLFEATRWAPSSYGEQPWRYIYAAKGDASRETLENLLVEGNSWAKNAGLLILSFAKKNYEKNGKPNKHFFHDTGAATFALTLQATDMGLSSHQMGGFYADKANEELGVPEDFEPCSMIAIGYPGDPDSLSDDLQQREAMPRTRLSSSQIAVKNGKDIG